MAAKGEITIALDAMGGDNAPNIVVRGAAIARKRHPDVRFILFGDEAQVEPLLGKQLRLKSAVEMVHTTERVAGDAKPSVALRSGRNSSMRLAINAVKDGRAMGVVSAGNTGALMAMAKFVLKTLPGIDRPAIASFFPTMRGETVMLDLGANVSCDADNLVQFAVMGNVFARTVLGVERPTYALLNVGAEEIKGHEALQQAAATLRAAESLPGEFKGFVEGDDIAKGTVDVVATDGFTGNIALKTAEGAAKLYTESLRQAFKNSMLARLGYVLALNAIKKFRQKVDPRRYNGAIFLGLNGITVKSHGGTDAFGFANAIDVAVDMARHGILNKIRDDFAALPGTGSTAPSGAQEAAQ